jgi:Leucine-rich repeat (LRR) protein
MVLHHPKQGTKKVEGIFYKRSQCDSQGRNYCLDLDLSNLQLLIIHDHTDNASTDFQLFKVPPSQHQEHLCQLKTIFINGNFQHLPKQLWDVHSLKILDVEGLKMLKALHEGLGNLTSLTHLNLTQCKSLRTLPEGLRNLISLTTLRLWGCKNLTTLPEGLANLTSLTTLDLWGCKNLRTIPEGLGNLTLLTELKSGEC